MKKILIKSYFKFPKTEWNGHDIREIRERHEAMTHYFAKHQSYSKTAKAFDICYSNAKSKISKILANYSDALDGVYPYFHQEIQK